MSTPKQYVIGVDIGGSHISCALIDPDQKEIMAGSLINLPVDHSAEAKEIMEVWTEALDQCRSHIEEGLLAGIGFAMPGPFEYDTGIARFEYVHKYQHLNGVDVGEAVRKGLDLPKNFPVRFVNDASAFAMGEAWFGKTAGHHRSVAITLGTGFGSAFIEDGKPLVEHEQVPEQGCVWHLPYKKGIADDYFSTRWFIKKWKEQTGAEINGVKELSALAEKDPRAMELFREFGNNLGSFLSTWLKLFEVKMLVIGGNIAGAWKHYGNALQEALHYEEVNVRTELSELGEDAALIGSARLMEEEVWEQVKPLLTKM